ncbi:MAG: Bug family tripartite tricarboxylate transporter substrate binding protein [Pigmentiphaga sp.]
MKTKRRFLQALCAGILASGSVMATPVLAAEQAPLRILVGFPPGGATDVVGRILAERLRDSLGRPVVVDNRAGAGGQIATQHLKDAAPDGNTVMLTIDHSQLVIPLTITTADYDPVNDFTALGGVAEYYNALGVNSNVDATDMASFREWLKANPEGTNIGVPAAGSVPQFAVHLMGESFGVPLNSVPYKGGAPLVTDIVGGHVTGGVASMTDLIEQYKNGRVRILATSGENRNKTLPEIPTFAEAGVEGLEMNPWLGFVGPKGLSPEFVNDFNAALQKVLAEPDIQERLAALGNQVSATSPETLQQWIEDGTRHWGEVIKRSGYVPQ